MKYFRLCRAREEVTRVEVETRRLRTSIHDEEQAIKETVDHLNQTNPRLAKELETQHHYRAAVNARLLFRLDQIEAFSGYGGCRGIGRRATSPTDHSDSGNGK